MTEDPFGRREEDERDAFGNPIGRPADASPEAPRYLPPVAPEPMAAPSAPAAPAGPPAAPAPPATRAEGEQAGWWSAPQTSPADSTPTATYGARVVAAVVDALIRIAILVVGLLIGAAAGAGSDGPLVVGFALGWVAGLAYAPVMMARTGGQTLGHKASSTRIVRDDGTTLGGGGAFVREVLVKWALFDVVGGFFLLPTLLNYLWPLWDERDQALHDKMLHTRVVRA